MNEEEPKRRPFEHAGKRRYSRECGIYSGGVMWCLKQCIQRIRGVMNFIYRVATLSHFAQDSSASHLLSWNNY